MSSLQIIAVCSQIHTKHISTLCRQNVELLSVRLVVHTVTTGFQRANIFLSSTRQSWSRNRSVGSTRPWSGLSGFRFLAEAELSIFSKTPRPALVSTKSVIQWSRRVKRQGREAKYSLPFSTEFKHKWSNTFALHTRLHGSTETTLASSFIPRLCKRASKLVSVQAAVPSAVCVSHLQSHCLSLCLTLSVSLSRRLSVSVSLSLCLSVCLPRLSHFFSVSPSHCLSVSPSPFHRLSVSHRLCLTLSVSPPHRRSQPPHHKLHSTVTYSLHCPCNDTNCIVCEVRTGFSNTIQTAQHKNTALFNFHDCITLYMFQTYSSLSRAAWPWAI
jgi:hypothetical protein